MKKPTCDCLRREAERVDVAYFEEPCGDIGWAIGIKPYDFMKEKFESTKIYLDRNYCPQCGDKYE